MTEARIATYDQVAAILAPHIARDTTGPELEAIANDLREQFVIFSRPAMQVAEDRDMTNGYVQHYVNGSPLGPIDGSPEKWESFARTGWIDAEKRVSNALGYEAIYQFMQAAPEREAAAKEAKLEERRNEVALTFWPHMAHEDAYDTLNAGARKAVDRIIELEDQNAAND